MIKDARFWLTTFLEEQEQVTPLYKNFKREIENSGCYKMKVGTETIKIYTPELVVIFTSKELPALNMEIQKETTINGFDYLNTYIEAYSEGEQYFESEFKISQDTLYGVNAEQYVKDIHVNFFHVQHTGMNEGWGYVKKQYPLILTHEVIKEFGYYSGVVNKVEEQIKKHPRLFASFDKCEHNLLPKKNNAPQAPELAFFCSLIHKIGIDKKDETESAGKYCQRVCAKFKLDYTDRVRQNYSNSETKKLRKNLIEKVLPLIDNETKVIVENYLDDKQPLNQNMYV